MTAEQWNTLDSLKDWMEKWNIHKMMNTQGHQKDRVDWLCGEFSLGPTDWGCSGCIASRCETLYRIYTKELKVRENAVILNKTT